MRPGSLKAASTNRTVFSPGAGNAGRGDEGLLRLLDNFQPHPRGITIRERWSSRNRARSPPLAFPYASRKNDFCETFAGRVRRDDTMTATVAAPVVADGVGPNLFRNLAADKNRSYALSPLKFLSLRISHELPFERIFIHLPSRLSRGNRGKTAKLLGNFALLHALYYYSYP